MLSVLSPGTVSASRSGPVLVWLGVGVVVGVGVAVTGRVGVASGMG